MTTQQPDDLDTANPTHSEFARSWVASANVAGCDFPIQNLPFAVFRRAGSTEAFRGGVAIGDQVIDMAQVARTACLDGLAQAAAQNCGVPALNDFFRHGPRRLEGAAAQPVRVA